MGATNEPPPALAERVERVASALGAGADAGRLARIGAWIALISAWNTRIDLTAARTDDELVDLMLADALVLAARIPAGARVVDVGSGAGAPGLPLAIARADLAVTLVEPLQKRVAFLRNAVGAILPAGERPTVVRGRGEEIAARKQRFDVAISRATLGPSQWIALGAELAGDVWVLLARDEPPAREGLQIVEDVRYRWPLTGAERRAVRYSSAGNSGDRESAR